MNATMPSLVRLRRYAEARESQLPRERCELCGVGIAPDHGHVVDVQHRSLQCVCRPCWLLFTQPGAGGARLRAVPARFERLSADDVDDQAWDALAIPIGLAFFLRSSVSGRVTAFYPSPAGPTESELALDAWQTLVQAVPSLATLEPDVEALLVRRGARPFGHHTAPADAFLVPIDVCYELVGRIKRSWQGFHGGDEVWREIDALFDRIAAHAAGRPA